MTKLSPKPLTDRSEIQHFTDEDECAAFWETHELTAEYLRKYAYPPDYPRVKRLRELITPRVKRQAS